MKLYTRFILRYAGWVAFFGTLLGLLGSYYTVLLYKNLRPNIEELLPTTARSVIDLKAVTQRLSSIDSLVVLVFSEDTSISKKFVTDLAESIKKIPKDTVSDVEYRINKEIEFFKERRTLFIDYSDLELMRKFIKDRLGYEKELYNPLNIFSTHEIEEPKLDYKGLLKKYSGRTSGFDHFKDGYFATPDEKIRGIVVYMPGKPGDIVGSQKLKKAVQEAVEKLNPKSYSKKIEVKYTGNIQSLIEENAALMADLELSTVIVVLLVSLCMVLYYRSFRATAALLFSLFMGTFWTFGVSYFVVGYLNANSAFMASIVIGNGINFGIIFLARYLEERWDKNHQHLRACWVALSQTGTSTGTAALAAGLSYGSLMLTGFRGFNQFGVIGLIGMLLCWVSSSTLLPAYLTLFNRYWPIKNRKRPKPYLAGALATLVDRFPKVIWGLSLVALVLSISTFPKFKNGIIEMDLTKLRDKWSMEEGSGYLCKFMDEIFQRHLSPIVILPDNREDTQKIAEAFKKRKAIDGPNSMIASVQTLDDFVASDQLQKIAILTEIKSMLPPRLVKYLPQDEQKMVNELLSKKSFAPFSEKSLPKMISGKFSERDGSTGKMVLVDNALNRAADNAEELIDFVKTVREVADKVAPGTAIAGQLMITADMVAAIIHDGPKATFFAFVSVVFLVIILFRNVRTILLCLMSLGLGIAWLAGIILHWELKINFLNFIAFPITFGIGVDYGVNVFQRYREEGRGSILRVIRQTGGAVGLSSLTTMIGYGSLLIAGNQAFVSFGRLAVFGELTCLTAAVVSLPAYLKVKDLREKAKKRA